MKTRQPPLLFPPEGTAGSDKESSQSGFVTPLPQERDREGAVGEALPDNRWTGLQPLSRQSDRSLCRLLRARRMGKWHVLKCLKPRYADSPDARALLQKEFEIGYRLSHPHIAAVVGFEQVEGLGRCIVMEYVDGRTLRHAIRHEPWSRQLTLGVMRQLGQALDYIHQQQVIHRDVKPENILLTRNGDSVKLIDFGLSDADSYAILKQPAGTLRYAAPEQLVPGRPVDGRADIYALGAVLSEMPCLNRRLRRIARKCMAPQPSGRYSLAAEIPWQPALRPVHWLAAAAALLSAGMASWTFYLYHSSTPFPEPRAPRPSPLEVVARHDTVREIREVKVPREPQKIYIQSQPPPGIDQFYQWVRQRALDNAYRGLEWMGRRLPAVHDVNEVGQMSLKAQKYGKELTEREMAVELEKYVDRADPQYAVIFASAKAWQNEGTVDFWTREDVTSRLTEMYREAYDRIQREAEQKNGDGK